MKKIEAMTNEQEKQMIKFREECLSIGLNTSPIKREIKEHRKIVDYIYKNYLNLESPAIWYVDSPLMLNLIINVLPDLIPNLKKDLEINLESNLRSNLGRNLRRNLRSNLVSNLLSNLVSNLGDNLVSNLVSNLRSNLESNLVSNLGDNLRSNLESNLVSNLGDNLVSNLGRNLSSNLVSNLRSNLGDNLGDNLVSNLRSNLSSNLWSNLESNLVSNLRSNLESNLQRNLRRNLSSNLESNLRSNLGRNLGSNLESNLRRNLRSNLVSNLLSNNKRFENVYWSNLDIYWICFYMFPQTLGIKYNDFETTSLNVLFEMTQKCGFIWYFKGICFISDRPAHIHKKGIQLHHETEPSISFRDGYSVWCLNGVNVPRYLVETPAEKLTIDQFNKETNADVRAEFIRKFGIERMVSLGKIVDTADEKSGEWERRSEYQLINMGACFNRTTAMFLKMKNQSTGIWHMEGVDPSCKTVKQALNFRYGSGIEIQSIK